MLSPLAEAQLSQVFGSFDDSPPPSGDIPLSPPVGDPTLIPGPTPLPPDPAG